jgi:putative hydrolase of the HAD superfamily
MPRVDDPFVPLGFQVGASASGAPNLGKVGSLRMYQAVLWDFGGVITVSPFEAFARYERTRGLPVGVIRQINATNPDNNAWARLERSEIDARQFDILFEEESRAHGCSIPGLDLLALLEGAVRPRMVAAVETCKAHGLKTGCITNNAPTGHGAGMSQSIERAAQIDAILARFDAVIESSKVGVRKPDRAIYQMMCDKLSVDPAACIYLDDLGINCKGAASLGMTAIKVVDETALDELGEKLGIRFS